MTAPARPPADQAGTDAGEEANMFSVFHILAALRPRIEATRL